MSNAYRTNDKSDDDAVAREREDERLDETIQTGGGAED